MVVDMDPWGQPALHADGPRGQPHAADRSAQPLGQSTRGIVAAVSAAERQLEELVETVRRQLSGEQQAELGWGLLSGSAAQLLVTRQDRALLTAVADEAVSGHTAPRTVQSHRSPSPSLPPPAISSPARHCLPLAGPKLTSWLIERRWSGCGRQGATRWSGRGLAGTRGWRTRLACRCDVRPRDASRETVDHSSKGASCCRWSGGSRHGTGR